MKTIAKVLVVSAAIAFSGGAAIAKDAKATAPAVTPPAAQHAVPMNDAAMSKVVAGAGFGIVTAVLTTPSASTPNGGVVNGAGGLAHAIGNTGCTPGVGNATAGGC